MILIAKRYFSDQSWKFVQVTPRDDGKVVRVTINRPEVHNAFNEVLISELNSSSRLVVLTGSGANFSAGDFFDIQF
jgi:enoyl-CoA hydratase/carnithine racemase